MADTGFSRRAPQADLGRTVTSRPKGCFQPLPRTVTLGQERPMANDRFGAVHNNDIKAVLDTRSAEVLGRFGPDLP